MMMTDDDAHEDVMIQVCRLCTASWAHEKIEIDSTNNSTTITTTRCCTMENVSNFRIDEVIHALGLIAAAEGMAFMETKHFVHLAHCSSLNYNLFTLNLVLFVCWFYQFTGPLVAATLLCVFTAICAVAKLSSFDFFGVLFNVLIGNFVRF